MKLEKYTKDKKALCFLDMPSLKKRSFFDKINNEANVYVSALKDRDFKASFFKCEIASTAFVLALLAKLGFEKEFLSLDEGYLSAESCFGEEEASELLDFLQGAEYIVFDTNLKFHKDYENIVFFINFLSKKFKLKVANSDEDEGELEVLSEFKELKELDNYDGLVLFNAKVSNLQASKQFLQLAKTKDQSEILLQTPFFERTCKIELNESLQGIIAFCDFQTQAYDFLKAQISQIKNL
ncbi:hypothetical protein DMB92_04775 [Campylobacter sp. MIT 99-7217]|uniref:hypothetical protein n=1 Tax=Campylobacter sp. MIT 99-7217 TaxID=535091 RepID=UPI00115B9F24|nr:hypothetical protein [Campylobacter sp. MIT 99-7217]TQR32414.1 hypothetical protein DMB92_04775 [Campylobacter sp. MIT 99-7217]